MYALKLKDNRLSVLDDKIVIKGYNSKLAFHHNKILPRQD
jgi:hypothetical protein